MKTERKKMEKKPKYNGTKLQLFARCGNIPNEWREG